MPGLMTLAFMCLTQSAVLSKQTVIAVVRYWQLTTVQRYNNSDTTQQHDETVRCKPHSLSQADTNASRYCVNRCISLTAGLLILFKMVNIRAV